MIVAAGLCKEFDGLFAVDEVDLNIHAGEVLALLGPNGAGKTTTVRLLTSVLRPTRGWARIDGHDVVQEAARVRALVGVLTEQHGLYGRMPAFDYMDFFGQIYGLDKTVRRKRITDLLTRFGLNPSDRRRIGEYSKGMRQKLALARALVHDPPVLLLDEPTSAMDPESARLVRDSIHSLRSANRAIIICTHNLNEAEELADQIAIIRRGRIIIQGTPNNLKRRYLGPKEFEVRLGSNLNGYIPILPPLAIHTAHGNDWLRYQSEQPEIHNPEILRILISQNFPVISLQEVERSLEQVYMEVINMPEKPKEADDAG